MAFRSFCPNRMVPRTMAASCLSQQSGFCLECAQLENILEDERYRVLEQIAALPTELTRDQIADAIRPITGDPLRRKESHADLGFQ